MPASIAVELQPYTPEWGPKLALVRVNASSRRLVKIFVVHHVGSTAIPTILAKPILDMMPVVRDLSLLDASRSTVESLRYKWWEKYAISGRRYCPLTEPATDRRIMQLHCFYPCSA